MDSQKRANVSALTKRGHSLIDKISALTDKHRLLGSEAVLELQGIICALRQIFRLLSLDPLSQ
jgi:hypothetical protein